jgi:hypothetical protein
MIYIGVNRILSHKEKLVYFWFYYNLFYFIWVWFLVWFLIWLLFEFYLSWFDYSIVFLQYFQYKFTIPISFLSFIPIGFIKETKIIEIFRFQILIPIGLDFSYDLVWKKKPKNNSEYFWLFLFVFIINID